MSRYRRTAISTVAFAGILASSACAASNESSNSGSSAVDSGLSGTISGAGASSQSAAIDAWKAGFERAHSGVTINYDPVGSGGGRTQFLADGVQFAGSDAYLNATEMAKVKNACHGGELVEFPIYISPIAVPFKVEGVDELQLSPDTMAGIFNGTIKTWNDSKIAADNPGVNLPGTNVTPVHRSDDSGTTTNFTDYLSKAAPSVWTQKSSGTWPITGGEAAKGTTGVVQAINAGEGTIGYADVSQIGALKHAKVKVGNEYVAYTPESAAKIVEVSRRAKNRPEYSYAVDLKRDTTESGSYPIVLVSYVEACTKYPDGHTAKLVKSWLTYVVSDEAQQAAGKAAGSAPISRATREDAIKGIDAIQ